MTSDRLSSSNRQKRQQHTNNHTTVEYNAVCCELMALNQIPIKGIKQNIFNDAFIVFAKKLNSLSIVSKVGSIQG